MKTKQELKALAIDALRQEVYALRQELFNLRLARLTGQVKDQLQGKHIRANIARCLTFIGQQELAAQSKPSGKNN